MFFRSFVGTKHQLFVEYLEESVFGNSNEDEKIQILFGKKVNFLSEKEYL